jgi:hypothetical protein
MTNVVSINSPKPEAVDGFSASRLQALANALEVADILTEASRLANELTRIAYKSEVLSRHPTGGKPTVIKLTQENADQCEEILKRLNELSTLYTERMAKPANAAHDNQPPKYKALAKDLAKYEPVKANGALSSFQGCRDQFEKNNSKPVDFASLIPGTVAVVKAAIVAAKLEANKTATELAGRRRGEAAIDIAARGVENDANATGTVSQNQAGALIGAVASGAKVGATAGNLGKVALQDVADDQHNRAAAQASPNARPGVQPGAHPTPFDSLKKMQPL